MKNYKLFAIMYLIGIGGSSAVLAKGHDQGVADGPPALENTGLFSRNGIVASHDIAGVGSDDQGNFFGVADSLNSDINYGQNVVQDQVANDTRRVIPVVNGRGVR